MEGNHTIYIEYKENLRYNAREGESMVRLRIAPSPTGYPHIGTMYQALFDYAFAKKNNGSFIVRIEDTDRQRFVEDAEKKLFEALDWFGLTEDESPRKSGPYAPYRQSERLSLYQKYATQLVEEKKAYYCDCSQERLEEVRKTMQENKQVPMYDKHCRELGKTQGVIRLKIPLGQKITVVDEIRGEIVFESAAIDDQVLLKSDGFPTYHLAVVVDDHLMKISHVVRGEEWITSTPKHFLLYEYLGFERPLFFHTAVLRNPDKSKLSKRHSHTNVSWYKENGFVKEAILNFLALMGWSHPEEKEMFSLDEFVSCFDLKDLKAVGPIFDLQKLEWMNGCYIRDFSIEELESRLKEYEPRLDQFEKNTLRQLVTLSQSRLKRLTDFYPLVSHFITSPSWSLSAEEKEVAQVLYQQIETIVSWEKDAIFASLKTCMEQCSVRMPILYKILTGNEKGLPLPESLVILGKEKVLSRLKYEK